MRLCVPLPRPSLLLGALLVPLLSACSMIELGYSQAPSLLAGRLDRAFDLGDYQEKRLRRALDEFHEWHREHELLRYEVVFSAAAERAADGVDADEIVWLIDEVRAARDRITARLIDELAPVAAALKPRQIEHFRRFRSDDLEEDLAERRRPDWPGKLGERRLERIEDWVGSLGGDLEARALQRLAQVPDSFESWGRYRARRDALIADALESSRSPEQIRARLREVLLDPQVEYRRAFETDRQVYWQQYTAAIVDIFAWLEDGQRERIVDKLRDYARIARSLRT